MKTFEIITLCLDKVTVKNCTDFSDALKKANLRPGEILSIKEVQ